MLDSACEVFTQFLGLYPYCYGYWKKYADLVRRLCSDEKARDVLEEGVAAIPLSVDLWLHYANFTVTFQSGSPQAEELIRRSKLISFSHSVLYHFQLPALTLESTAGS